MRSSLFTQPSRMEVSHVEIKKGPARGGGGREGCKREGERTGECDLSKGQRGGGG